MGLDVGVLRELLRNFRAFMALYETEGIDSITGPDGEVFCLWDLSYLVEQIPKLPPKQAQAIQLCLIDNVKEKDAAEMMGVSRTNPVGLYATAGISNLLAMVRRDELPRFRLEESRSA